VIGQKVLVVVRQTPCDGEELILSRKLLPKLHERSSQVVLAGEDGHSCVVS
jgi:hypothetical protein